MKTLSDDALKEQRSLTPHPVGSEIYFYKQYLGPITSITPPDTFTVEGDATALFSVGDTIIFTNMGLDTEVEILAITYVNCLTYIQIDEDLWSAALLWGQAS